LRKYVTAFATPIIGLTGSQAEIDRVVHAFHASVRRTPQEGGPDLISHTGTPYLIGKRGEYRALLSGADASDLALIRTAIQSP
jgi:protein SCO1/2